jgi:DNA-binding NarL/FixJ family response regulator
MKSQIRNSALIKIVVLKGDPLRFIGLRALLESQKDLELSFVDRSEIETMRSPDVFLLAERDGIGASHLLEDLRIRRPDIKVVVVGSGSEVEGALAAIATGAKGYISENAANAEFVSAIRTVSQGLIWASRKVFSLIIDRFSGSSRRVLAAKTLTSRERQVLEMLVAGRSNKEIAAPLGIEERTVKAHVSKIMRKVGVENRIQLSVHAITHALVTASNPN